MGGSGRTSSHCAQVLCAASTHSLAELAEVGNGRAFAGERGLRSAAAGHPATDRPDPQRPLPPRPVPAGSTGGEPEGDNVTGSAPPLPLPPERRARGRRSEVAVVASPSSLAQRLPPSRSRPCCRAASLAVFMGSDTAPVGASCTAPGGCAVDKLSCNAFSPDNRWAITPANLDSQLSKRSSVSRAAHPARYPIEWSGRHEL